jgi:hypothetical protein
MTNLFEIWPDSSSPKSMLSYENAAYYPSSPTYALHLGKSS